MNATWSITAFVVIDDLMTALKHKSHPLAQASDAEVLTVAIVAAKPRFRTLTTEQREKMQRCFLCGKVELLNCNCSGKEVWCSLFSRPHQARQASWQLALHQAEYDHLMPLGSQRQRLLPHLRRPLDRTQKRPARARLVTPGSAWHALRSSLHL